MSFSAVVTNFKSFGHTPGNSLITMQKYNIKSWFPKEIRVKFGKMLYNIKIAPIVFRACVIYMFYNIFNRWASLKNYS